MQKKQSTDRQTYNMETHEGDDNFHLSGSGGKWTLYIGPNLKLQPVVQSENCPREHPNDPHGREVHQPEMRKDHGKLN